MTWVTRTQCDEHVLLPHNADLTITKSILIRWRFDLRLLRVLDRTRKLWPQVQRLKPISVLLFLSTVGAAAGAGLALDPVEPPRSLAGSTVVAVVPVGTEGFTDGRKVEVDITFEAGNKLAAPAAGTVTATSCTAGGTIKSGSVPVELDGRPKIALATGVPPWRDFTLGLRGSDVSALQRELRRLGGNVRVTGQYDAQTRRAVRALPRGRLLLENDGSLRNSSIVWLSQPQRTVSECDAPLGTVLSPGGLFATLVADVASARIKAYPGDLVPGDRVLRVGDTKLRVDRTGNVPNRADLHALAATGEFALYRDSEGKVPLVASLELSQEIAVSAIPPSAVVQVSAGTCVLDAAGHPYAVQIVGSTLGRTLVTWSAAGEAPAEVLVKPDESATCS